MRCVQIFNFIKVDGFVFSTVKVIVTQSSTEKAQSFTEKSNRLRALCAYLALSAVNLLLLLFTLPASAQLPAFHPPLDIPFSLSGTFGELRTNHFHSGIDLRTQQREGLPVYAAEDGFVDRIRVSPTGYGKALYIRHPNGYSTVYAHLRNFEPVIEQYVRQRQYEKESFDIELFPEVTDLQVKRGQLIAYSGNSGSSGGPHLHYEIRDTRTSEVVNPLLFPFKIADKTPPVIRAVAVHDRTAARYFTPPVRMNAKKQSTGKFSINREVVEVNSNRVGIAVDAIDQQDGANNNNGVFAITLIAGQDTVYHFRISRFAFDETRYLNAHIDYSTRYGHRSTFAKCFIEPGNNFSVYDRSKGDGIIHLTPGDDVPLRLLIADAQGNVSETGFTLRYNEDASTFKPSDVEFQCMYPYAQETLFQQENIRIDFPSGTFYDTVFFTYSADTASVPGLFSPIHKLHHPGTPLHRFFIISLLPAELPAHLMQKAVVVYRKDRRSDWESKGGTFTGNRITTRSRDFGEYSIAIDTVAPVISPINIPKDSVMTGMEQLRVRIKDDLAGIKTYRGMINGRWILMEYDPKNNLLSYEFDDRAPAGTMDFALEVTDETGNRSYFSTKIKR